MRPLRRLPHARSLAPALFARGAVLESCLIYMVGPLTGAVVAAAVYDAIRGGDEHAQGAPNYLGIALQKMEAIGD